MAVASSTGRSSNLIARCFRERGFIGRVPDELDENLAWRVGLAFGQVLDPGNVVLGHDVRLSSPALAAALADGLRAAGVNVHDIGQCGTEEVAFAVGHLRLGGGVMIGSDDASPAHNGMSFLAGDARAIDIDTGLSELLVHLVARGGAPVAVRGHYQRQGVRQAYVHHLLGCIDVGALRPTRVVVNAGNGSAGPVFDAIAEHLPLEVVPILHQPDGRFPRGVPDPAAEPHRQSTANAVQSTHAALGIAWSTDFSRCVLFDDRGRHVDSYYAAGLLAQALLAKRRGTRVLHDARLRWNTQELVTEAGGVAVQGPSEPTLFDRAMRDVDAVYGGELDGRHCFRDFLHRESGMLPWLLVLEQLSASGTPLSVSVAERMHRFPATSEIRRPTGDIDAVLQRVETLFAGPGGRVSHFDGVGVEYDDWRFNLRQSRIDASLQLDVESRGDEPLMRGRTEAILHVLDMPGGRATA